MSKRHKAREIGLEILYSLDIKDELSPTKGLNGKELEEDWQKDIPPFSLSLTLDILKNLNQIDKLITSASKNWKIERMSTIDRNILRIGVAELLKQELPPPIIINEALLLAKNFGAKNSPAFINGILDHISKIDLQVNEG